MNIASFVVVYIIAWWLIFFMSLPIGVRRNDNPEEGHDIGAPVKHMVGKKMLWTSVLAAIVLGIYWYAVEVVGITIIDLPNR